MLHQKHGNIIGLVQTFKIATETFGTEYSSRFRGLNQGARVTQVSLSALAPFRTRGAGELDELTTPPTQVRFCRKNTRPSIHGQ